MLTLVLVFNASTALLCLFVAWRLWQLRRTLAQVTRTLTNAERVTYAVLHGAPNGILRGQMGAYQLQQRYRLLEQQLQKVQQVLALLSWGQILWRSRLDRSGSRSRLATRKRRR